MALPIILTGSRQHVSTPDVHRSASLTAKQAKPFTLVSPYEGRWGKLTGKRTGRENVTPTSASSVSSVYLSAGDVNHLKIMAYEKLKGNLMAEAASLGAQLTVERKEAVQMISQRGQQLWTAFRRLRRGHPKEAWDILTSVWGNPPGRTRYKAKDVGGVILEHNFGWAPMIGDIYNAVDILQQPLKNPRATGKARDSGPTYTNGSNPPPLYSAFRSWKWEKVEVVYGAEAAITNPNLFLANQLGLVNPATIIWEGIPFSFMVDWFVNVEQVLGSFTDFLGLELSNGRTTIFDRGTCTVIWNDPPSPYGPGLAKLQYGHLSRIIGLDKPSFGLRKLQLPSLTRAINICALLSGKLKSL